MKVVFHIDNQERWDFLKGNINNFRKEVENVDIVVVANGDAVKGYLDENLLDFFESGKAKFHICNNAMKTFEIKKEDIPNVVEIVPAGVVDVVKLQDKGYAYIKL